MDRLRALYVPLHDIEDHTVAGDGYIAKTLGASPGE